MRIRTEVRKLLILVNAKALQKVAQPKKLPHPANCCEIKRLRGVAEIGPVVVQRFSGKSAVRFCASWWLAEVTSKKKGNLKPTWILFYALVSACYAVTLLRCHASHTGCKSAGFKPEKRFSAVWVFKSQIRNRQFFQLRR
jgi:hypothetical protein